MDRKQQLLKRLDEIGQSLRQTGKAWALLGLGSSGAEISRLDEYSDLDFFVIAKEGHKDVFIDNLDWLNRVAAIGYSFRNTVDGHKVLFQDGIYCEFAVFEPAQLTGISYASGRIIWQDPDFETAICMAQTVPALSENRTIEWLVGEILTNLYVGLCRDKRGEALAAFRLIQVHAVDRLIEAAQYLEKEQPVCKDQFSNVRRFEQRFPEIARLLATFVQGYKYNKGSAKAILEFLDNHFHLNAAIKMEITKLL